ncbi:hypothetical protein [Xanthobacter sp. VNH20]|uniref:hypothetical protein n=1 Tax=Xanthobacter sp. VNH20 TaxID=3156616 RepID=UPI0032B5F316
MAEFDVLAEHGHNVVGADAHKRVGFEGGTGRLRLGNALPDWQRRTDEQCRSRSDETAPSETDIKKAHDRSICVGVAVQRSMVRNVAA